MPWKSLFFRSLIDEWSTQRMDVAMKRLCREREQDEERFMKDRADADNDNS